MDNNNSLNQNDKTNIPELKSKRDFKKEDFEIISISGKGSYGTVFKVKLKNDSSNKIYAIKVMEINTMKKFKKLHHIYLENEILYQLNHPNIENLIGSFKTNEKTYFVFDYLSKGDFSDFLKYNNNLNDKTIRFYSAEIVNMLEYLQSKNIIHRDLKPENIMLDDKNHLKLIDFATVKIINKKFDKDKMTFINENEKTNLNDNNNIMNNIDNNNNNIDNNKNIDNNYKINNNIIDNNNLDNEDNQINKKRSMSFVGSAEYVSPEILSDNEPSFGTDIWALGCIIYKMYYNKTPFIDKTQYLIFKNIEKNEINFDSNISIPEDAKDIIKQLLIKDPFLRLGGGNLGSKYDINSLKKHPFFNNINFDNLINENPPFENEFNFSYLNIDSNNNNNDNIEILKEDILEKKSPWFHYNKRKVILYSTPKIDYIDPKTNEIKGTIELNKDCKAEHINMSSFNIITPNRTFKFKVSDNSAYIWEKIINDAIKNYSKN